MSTHTGGYTGPIGTAAASDNCTSSPSATSNAPLVFPLGTTTVTWTATDDAGNPATATQLVTVLELAAITIELVSPGIAMPEETASAGIEVRVATATGAAVSCAGSHGHADRRKHEHD